MVDFYILKHLVRSDLLYIASPLFFGLFRSLLIPFIHLFIFSNKCHVYESVFEEYKRYCSANENENEMK
jgi:hypothetical protein